MPVTESCSGGRPVASEEITVGRLVLTEYERLKEEQRARIGFRDNLLYATLASLAAVMVAVDQKPGKIPALLLFPPVCVLLGWTYLVNDEKISAIGRYIRTEIAPRLSAMLPEGEAVFGWESAHRSDPRRVSRKYCQLAVDLLAFCVAPLAALAFYWVTRPGGHGVFLVVSLAEAVAIVVLAGQIIQYAQLTRPSAAPRPR